MNKLAGCFAVMLVILAIVGMLMVFSTLLIYWGWNLVISPIFGLMRLTFLQAFLLGLLLSAVGGFFKTSVTTKNE